MGVVNQLHERYVVRRRSDVLARYLAALVPRNCAVLDVGCGDGRIADAIGKLRPDVDVRGIDIVLRPRTEISVGLFDGKTIPLADRSIDTVMMVDVLHHTDDPMLLMTEAARVARTSIVLKDHFLEGVLAGPTLRLMDQVGNAGNGVRLPHNYWPEARWIRAFAQLGLEISRLVRQPTLYPFPASIIFGRRLHFICELLVQKIRVQTACPGTVPSQGAP